MQLPPEQGKLAAEKYALPLKKTGIEEKAKEAASFLRVSKNHLTFQSNLLLILQALTKLAGPFVLLVGTTTILWMFMSYFQSVGKCL